MGFFITAEVGISMNPEKIASVKYWDRPVNPKRIRLSLEFANFYLAFIPDSSNIVAPLTKVTDMILSQPSSKF